MQRTGIVNDHVHRPGRQAWVNANTSGRDPLGLQSGAVFLRRHLGEIEALGINHVALNLRFGQRSIKTMHKRPTNDILPDFS